MNKEEIVAKIAEADKAYYTNGTSALSDYEYDILKKDLLSMDPTNPILSSLGEDHVEGSGTVQRTVKMLSLEKIQQNKENPEDISAILKWLESRGATLTDIVVEPKVDGMSAEAKYEYGVLKCVSTRGAGDSGDDITATTKQCFPEKLDKFLSEIAELNIRGELYISKEEYERINAQQRANGEPIFANARNLCAGTVKSKEVIPDRNISFIAHGFGYTSVDIKYFSDFYVSLRRNGISVIPTSYPRNNPALLESLNIFKTKDLPFYIDGVVIKLDSIARYKEAGETEHHPKGAVAFKFIPEVKETTVKDIIWQIGGKTGKAVPVAVVEPVALSGSIVERVTLSNAGLMAHRGIRVGSKVMVEKANEIIPHIAAVVEGTSYDLEPTIKCPCCNSDMNLVDGKSEPTKDYVCPNEDCPARKTALLHAALGTRGINVMGIGPEICADFIAKYPDLNAATFLQLSPDEYPESMSELQRANLHKEARVARKAPLWRWISAMNIPDIGDTSAKTITRTCKNLREFIKAAMDPMYAPIDISDRRKEACKEYILSKGNVAQELLEMALNPESDNYVEKSDNAALDGKAFVVTGSFDYGRAAIEDMIPKFGGVLKKSVSSKVDYVVCGSDPGASKITKAGKLQIPIISEAELFQLIQSNQNDN